MTTSSLAVRRARLDRLDALEPDHAVVPRFLRRLLRDARRRAADVERPHRQLRARLADRLRGDDADRLADFDHACRWRGRGRSTSCRRRGGDAQVSTERIFTFSMPASSMRCARSSSISWLASMIVSPRERVDELLERDAADDPVAQRLDDLAAFDDGPRLDAVERAAVDLGDDHVLRHVDETPRQVARVGRLQRRVGQALARAVRRDEVLEHRQPFTEVRRDGRLDDLARRLGHQAAHAGQLADLLLAAARAGVGHDVDRVEAARPCRWSFISLEHLVRDFSVVSDQMAMTLLQRSPLVMAPSRYCCSTRMTSCARLVDELFFSLGMTRSSMPIDRPDSRRVGEPEVLQPVEHLDGALRAP